MNILITGGTSGIALKVAKRLYKDNTIYLGVHTEEQLSTVKENLKEYESIIPIKLDVTKKKDIKALKDMKIDVLYLHAGVGYGGSIIDIPSARVRENYEVNVFGNFEVLRTVIKNMINYGSGRIVIMASLLGIMPFKFLGVYASTKASIISLSTALKKELKMLNKNIKVCLIEPGAYKTGFNEVMIENKYDYMSKNSYFSSVIGKIKKQENLVWKLIEQKNMDSIVNKIEDAITSKSPKFIYRAPFLQVLSIKLYSLFFM